MATVWPHVALSGAVRTYTLTSDCFQDDCRESYDVLEVSYQLCHGISPSTTIHISAQPQNYIALSSGLVWTEGDHIDVRLRVRVYFFKLQAFLSKLVSAFSPQFDQRS